MEVIKYYVVICIMCMMMFGLGACVGNNTNKTTETTTEVVTEVATNMDVATGTNVSTESTTTEKPTTEATTEVTTEESTTVAATTEAIAQATTEATTTQVPATTSAPTTTQAPTTTEAPKPSCNHNWVAQTKVVHHDAVGHMETKQTYIDANGNDLGLGVTVVNIDGKKYIEVGRDPYYICNACGTKFYGRDYGGEPGAGIALSDHKFSTGHGSSSASSDPIYVEVFYKEIAVFVEDTPAWDETVTTGYKCSICGDTK